MLNDFQKLPGYFGLVKRSTNDLELLLQLGLIMDVRQKADASSVISAYTRAMKSYWHAMETLIPFVSEGSA
jgi:hypothetical protein